MPRTEVELTTGVAELQEPAAGCAELLADVAGITLAPDEPHPPACLLTGNADQPLRGGRPARQTARACSVTSRG